MLIVHFLGELYLFALKWSVSYKRGRIGQKSIFSTIKQKTCAKPVRKRGQIVVPVRAYRRWAGPANPNVQIQAVFLQACRNPSNGQESQESRSGRNFGHFEDSGYSIWIGWWYIYPSEKYECVNWDDELLNIFQTICFE